MKRRGFLGSIVSIVAASALPKAVELEPIRLSPTPIRLEDIPEDSVLAVKAKSKYIASGMMPETEKQVNVAPDGKSRWLMSG